MRLRLQDGLHHCFCSDRSIFLDSPANRYFGLPPAMDSVFARIARGEEIHDSEQPIVGRLLAANVLVEAGEAEAADWPRPIAPPSADLSPHPDRPVTVRQIVRALRARLRARHLVKGRNIAEIQRLAMVRPSGKARASVNPPAQSLQQLRAAFAVADRFISARDQCLPRSLAICALGREFGIETNVVLGVRVNPFLAHCWVEFDGLVLSGDFEQARLFVPIMRLQ